MAVIVRSWDDPLDAVMAVKTCRHTVVKRTLSISSKDGEKHGKHGLWFDGVRVTARMIHTCKGCGAVIKRRYLTQVELGMAVENVLRNANTIPIRVVGQ